jgi:hypothetical protein
MKPLEELVEKLGTILAVSRVVTIGLFVALGVRGVPFIHSYSDTAPLMELLNLYSHWLQLLTS